MPPPNEPTTPILSILPRDPIEPEPHILPNHTIRPVPNIALTGGKLTVKGIPVLTEVPSNVTFTPFSISYSKSDAPASILRRVESSSHRGGFLGFTQKNRSGRLLNSIRRFDGRDFLSIFRFKTWWSTMWVGRSGSDLQRETQWVLLDVPELRAYALIVPIIEASFRAALGPGDNGHVMLWAESGSTQVKGSSFYSIAYVHVSDSPYTLMKEAFAALRVHLNSFRLLEEKPVPELVDKFGWCTWDAFYLAVEPIGVWHGVKELHEGGVQPRFLIIDDGWQCIGFDQEAKNLVLGGEQMTARLIGLREGEKFGKYVGGSLLNSNALPYDLKKPKRIVSKAIELEKAQKELAKAVQEESGTDLSELQSRIERLKRELDETIQSDREKAASAQVGGHRQDDLGLKAFTRDLKTKFKGLDDIYVWHALCGAWGGVRPGSTHLDSKVIPCTVSSGLDCTMHDLAVVKIVEGGIGLVHPSRADDFYDSGVKVDVIHTLEYVSEEYGGRVELAKAYYKALTDSLRKNFRGKGFISSMQQCNDFFFLGTRQISMGRVGDDFWFQDPNGDPMGAYWLQGVHMIHCSYNSLWMGQIIHPDWDMFQSDHLCAEFHAGSRAVCGSPIYVSDSVGSHDFELLRRLVFSDGTIPKCMQFALPTRDCLFKNPLFDKETVLKLWNFNKFGGVIGAFNCQGAGWDPKEQRIRGFPDCYKSITGSVHVRDIEWNQCQELTRISPSEEFAVYLNKADQLVLMTPRSDPIQVTLDPSSFEIFSFMPIKMLGKWRNLIMFAPVGLKNMYNSAGTIIGLEYANSTWSEARAKVRVKGEGTFSAYSSRSPKKCTSNGNAATFEWSRADGKLIVNLPWNEESGGITDLVFVF